MTLYARLAGLLPPSFSDEYAADMVTTFDERARDARQRGRLRYFGWYMRELWWLLRVVVAEHLSGGFRKGRGMSMDQIGGELLHAWRRLVRTPGFTLAAVVTLALALGANAAIFTLVQRVVLAPLPYAESDGLIALDHAAPGLDLPSGIGMSLGLYREYATMPVHEALSIYTHYGMTMSGEGDAERLDVIIATPSLADVLRLRPALGRWFTAAEGRPDGGGVTVLTHEFWQARFGGDERILGRTLRLDGRPFEVIGVLPRGFAFPDDRPKLFLPLQVDLTNVHPGGFNFRGVARLAAGESAARARADHNAVIADLPARFPAHPQIADAMITDVRLSSLATSLKENMTGDATRMLWVLLGAVGIVLLIACANIANLFLVRTDARQRELAVRRALGAGSGRLAIYFAAETALVCAVAAGAGLLLAWLALQVVVAADVVRLPRLHEVQFGPATVSFTLLLTVLAAASFGLLPLLRRQPTVGTVLQESGRSNTTSGVRMRARHALMALQVSLAVMLLVAAGLLVRSFDQLRRVDPGFAAESRLAFRVGLSDTEHRSNESTAAFHAALLERVARIPGVEQVALATTLPLDGDGWGDPFSVRGRTGDGIANPIVRMRRVSADYFAVMSIPLIAGRGLDEVDATGVTNAVVVNRAFVEQYFPGEDPIGRQVLPIGREDVEWLNIVGVVGNTATYSLREPAAVAKVYLPLLSATTAGLPTSHAVSYVVRTPGDPAALVPAIRRALEEQDPHVALARAEPLTELVSRSQASLAFTMILLVTAASVALLLGLIGVYAVISYGVAQRRAEIGVRIALGAAPVEVTRMIVRQSGAIIAAGVITGIAGAVAGTRLMSALLYGVAPTDISTYVAAAAGLFMVALVASWLPARRAARSHPLRSL